VSFSGMGMNENRGLKGHILLGHSGAAQSAEPGIQNSLASRTATLDSGFALTRAPE
jgi:hypothetical protein